MSDFHRQQLGLVDQFHFPSSISETIFKSHVPGIQGVRIPVSHRGISDHRVEVRIAETAVVRIGFVGDSIPYKGYSMLRRVLERLRSGGLQNWELHVHGPGHEHDLPGEGVKIHGPYKPGQQGRVYGEMDLLVVPSLWMETFSLVTLEALSYGVPVLLLSSVGAKDVVESLGLGNVVDSGEAFVERLTSILRDPSLLADWRERIHCARLPLDHAEHCSLVECLYRNVHP